MAGTIDQHSAWLQARNLRAATIYQRTRALHRLAQHLDGTPLLAATPEQIADHLARHNRAESKATELSHYRGFYRWALSIELIDTDPTARLPRPKTQRRVPLPPSRGDLYMALDLAPERIRPWLLLAAYAGLRAAEIGLLTAEDLWWHMDPPIVVVLDGKGGQQGAVPMCTYLATELRDAGLPRRGWLFPRRDGKPGPTPAHIVSQRTNRFLHDMGFSWTIHKARHWFGTESLRASNGNLRLTQELMRHATSRSTEIYTLIESADRATAVERLPNPARSPGEDGDRAPR